MDKGHPIPEKEQIDPTPGHKDRKSPKLEHSPARSSHRESPKTGHKDRNSPKKRHNGKNRAIPEKELTNKTPNKKGPNKRSHIQKLTHKKGQGPGYL